MYYKIIDIKKTDRQEKKIKNNKKKIVSSIKLG